MAQKENILQYLQREFDNCTIDREGSKKISVILLNPKTLELIKDEANRRYNNVFKYNGSPRAYRDAFFLEDPTVKENEFIFY